MDNIVRFAIGLMSAIMLVFGAVMYFGLNKTKIVTTPEGQTLGQVEKWMKKRLTDEDREIVNVGKECVFEGEERRYRIVTLRVKGETDPAKVERFILQSRPQGEVTYHWTAREFIDEKMKSAKTEPTPERVAWYEKRWRALLTEMGVNDIATPSPAGAAAVPAVGK